MKVFTASVLTSLALAAPALAAYTQEASTFSAGGGVSTSAGHENLGVIGQSGIVGSSSGGSYIANHGFLSVLGDGFKILYPVISATQGTLTFSLMTGTSGNQPLGISNSGGSSLNWTVSKGSDPGNVFGFTPASGSNNGTVTVTANAAGLTPGTYSNTLIISGAGISQTALVQLDLTVTPTLYYTLAVTLKLSTPGKGGGTVTSTSPPGLTCQRTGGTSDVTCSHDFVAGSTVTLSQTPDSNTQRATWGAPGCGSAATCTVVLDAPKGTDVTFPYSSMAKINLGNGYESLAQAYGNAAVSDTIKARAVTFPLEDLLLNSGKNITLQGGLDAYYAAQAGQYSTLSGKLTVGTGSLTVDKLIIK